MRPPDDDCHEALATHACPLAWLVRHTLDAPPVRWLGISSASTALTVIAYRPGLPPAVTAFSETSQLPAELRWTGLPTATRP